MTPMPESTAAFYPIALRLEGRRALVVGGGKVAARKVEGLLAAGADVVVVSPSLAPAFSRVLGSRSMTWLEREYDEGDVAGVSLVIAATDVPDVNARVSTDARQARVPVCVVDDPDASDFIVPAVVRRGDLVLAISSGGASPALVGLLRRELDQLFPEDTALLVRVLAKARSRVQGMVEDPERRREMMKRLLTVDLLSLVGAAQAGEALIRQIDALIEGSQPPAPRQSPGAAARTPAARGRDARR